MELTPYTYTRRRETLFSFWVDLHCHCHDDGPLGVCSNRIASLRKREALLLSVVDSNRPDSEMKLLVRCGGVNLGRRQDFCAPQATTFAPQARFFLIQGKPELDTHDENCTAGR